MHIVSDHSLPHPQNAPRSPPPRQSARLGMHIVSDHLVLAGAVVAGLHAELLCCLSDMRAAAAARRGAARALEVGADAILFAGAAALMALTTADIFYTAKYYHYPLVSMGGRPWTPRNNAP